MPDEMTKTDEEPPVTGFMALNAVDHPVETESHQEQPDATTEITEAVGPKTSVADGCHTMLTVIASKISEAATKGKDAMEALATNIREGAGSLVGSVLHNTKSAPDAGQVFDPPPDNQTAAYLVDKLGIEPVEANSKTAPGSNL